MVIGVSWSRNVRRAYDVMRGKPNITSKPSVRAQIGRRCWIGGIFRRRRTALM
jgi:hypothetical protein